MFLLGERGWLSGTVTYSWPKGLRFESWQEWWENFLLQCQLSVLIHFGIPFTPTPTPSPHPLVTAVACKISYGRGSNRYLLTWHFSQDWTVNTSSATTSISERESNRYLPTGYIIQDWAVNTWSATTSISERESNRYLPTGYIIQH